MTGSKSNDDIDNLESGIDNLLSPIGNRLSVIGIDDGQSRNLAIFKLQTRIGESATPDSPITHYPIQIANRRFTIANQPITAFRFQTID